MPDYWIVNLAEGLVEVHRDPQPAGDEPCRRVYRSVARLRPPATVVPLGAPATPIRVSDLLP